MNKKIPRWDVDDITVVAVNGDGYSVSLDVSDGKEERELTLLGESDGAWIKLTRTVDVTPDELASIQGYLDSSRVVATLLDHAIEAAGGIDNG